MNEDVDIGSLTTSQTTSELNLTATSSPIPLRRTSFIHYYHSTCSLPLRAASPLSLSPISIRSPASPGTPVFDGIDVSSSRKFDRHICEVKDEQEIVQQRVFMSWINHFVPNCIESNLVEELRDGTKLIALLYALTGEKIHEERGRHLKRIHFICNVQRALDFLQNKGLELINIRATDIVDGNPRIILGLIWIIILRFHIEEFMRLWHLETNESHHMFDHSFIPAQHRSAWKQDLKYKQFGTQLENSSSSIQTNECITTTSNDENNFSVVPTYSKSLSRHSSATKIEEPDTVERSITCLSDVGTSNEISSEEKLMKLNERFQNILELDFDKGNNDNLIAVKDSGSSSPVNRTDAEINFAEFVNIEKETQANALQSADEFDRTGANDENNYSMVVTHSTSLSRHTSELKIEESNTAERSMAYLSDVEPSNEDSSDEKFMNLNQQFQNIQEMDFDKENDDDLVTVKDNESLSPVNPTESEINFTDFVNNEKETQTNALQSHDECASTDANDENNYPLVTHSSSVSRHSIATKMEESDTAERSMACLSDVGTSYEISSDEKLMKLNEQFQNIQEMDFEKGNNDNLVTGKKYESSSSVDRTRGEINLSEFVSNEKETQTNALQSVDEFDRTGANDENNYSMATHSTSLSRHTSELKIKESNTTERSMAYLSDVEPSNEHLSDEKLMNLNEQFENILEMVFDKENDDDLVTVKDNESLSHVNPTVGEINLSGFVDNEKETQTNELVDECASTDGNDENNYSMVTHSTSVSRHTSEIKMEEPDTAETSVACFTDLEPSNEDSSNEKFVNLNEQFENILEMDFDKENNDNVITGKKYESSSTVDRTDSEINFTDFLSNEKETQTNALKTADECASTGANDENNYSMVTHSASVSRHTSELKMEEPDRAERSMAGLRDVEPSNEHSSDEKFMNLNEQFQNILEMDFDKGNNDNLVTVKNYESPSTVNRTDSEINFTDFVSNEKETQTNELQSADECDRTGAKNENNSSIVIHSTSVSRHTSELKMEEPDTAERSMACLSDVGTSYEISSDEKLMKLNEQFQNIVEMDFDKENNDNLVDVKDNESFSPVNPTDMEINFTDFVSNEKETQTNALQSVDDCDRTGANDENNYSMVTHSTSVSSHLSATKVEEPDTAERSTACLSCVGTSYEISSDEKLMKLNEQFQNIVGMEFDKGNNDNLIAVKNNGSSSPVDRTDSEINLSMFVGNEKETQTNVLQSADECAGTDGNHENNYSMVATRSTSVSRHLSATKVEEPDTAERSMAYLSDVEPSNEHSSDEKLMKLNEQFQNILELDFDKVNNDSLITGKKYESSSPVDRTDSEINLSVFVNNEKETQTNALQSHDECASTDANDENNYSMVATHSTSVSRHTSELKMEEPDRAERSMAGLRDVELSNEISSDEKLMKLNEQFQNILEMNFDKGNNGNLVAVKNYESPSTVNPTDSEINFTEFVSNEKETQTNDLQSADEYDRTGAKDENNYSMVVTHSTSVSRHPSEIKIDEPDTAERSVACFTDLEPSNEHSSDEKLMNLNEQFQNILERVFDKENDDNVITGKDNESLSPVNPTESKITVILCNDKEAQTNTLQSADECDRTGANDENNYSMVVTHSTSVSRHPSEINIDEPDAAERSAACFTDLEPSNELSSDEKLMNLNEQFENILEMVFDNGNNNNVIALKNNESSSPVNRTYGDINVSEFVSNEKETQTNVLQSAYECDLIGANDESNYSMATHSTSVSRHPSATKIEEPDTAERSMACLTNVEPSNEHSSDEKLMKLNEQFQNIQEMDFDNENDDDLVTVKDNESLSPVNPTESEITVILCNDKETQTNTLQSADECDRTGANDNENNYSMVVTHSTSVSRHTSELKMEEPDTAERSVACFTDLEPSNEDSSNDKFVNLNEQFQNIQEMDFDKENNDNVIALKDTESTSPVKRTDGEINLSGFVDNEKETQTNALQLVDECASTDGNDENNYSMATHSTSVSRHPSATKIEEPDTAERTMACLTNVEPSNEHSSGEKFMNLNEQFQNIREMDFDKGNNDSLITGKKYESSSTVDRTDSEINFSDFVSNEKETQTNALQSADECDRTGAKNENNSSIVIHSTSVSRHTSELKMEEPDTAERSMACLTNVEPSNEHSSDEKFMNLNEQFQNILEMDFDKGNNDNLVAVKYYESSSTVDRTDSEINFTDFLSIEKETQTNELQSADECDRTGAKDENNSSIVIHSTSVSRHTSELKMEEPDTAERSMACLSDVGTSYEISSDEKLMKLKEQFQNIVEMEFDKENNDNLVAVKDNESFSPVNPTDREIHFTDFVSNEKEKQTNVLQSADECARTAATDENNCSIVVIHSTSVMRHPSEIKMEESDTVERSMACLSDVKPSYEISSDEKLMKLNERFKNILEMDFDKGNNNNVIALKDNESSSPVNRTDGEINVSEFVSNEKETQTNVLQSADECARTAATDENNYSMVVTYSKSVTTHSRNSSTSFQSEEFSSQILEERRSSSYSISSSSTIETLTSVNIPVEIVGRHHRRRDMPSGRGSFAYFRRAFRRSLPLQMLLLLLLGVASLVPTVDENYTCSMVNNLGYPIVNFPNGPPPI